MICVTQGNARILFLSLGLLCGLAPQASKAEGPVPSEISGGPYCGVYSVYAALRALDIDVRFEELLEHKYVGSYNGSSLGELSQAVVDFGCHAEAMQGLTAAALRAARHPIILHVRRPGLNMPYAHWMLFLGVEGDKARIVDPPNDVQLLPFAELLALWDGTGLVVSQEGAATCSLPLAAWFEQGVVLALAAILLLAIRLFNYRLGRIIPWGRGILVILIVSIALGTAFHLFREEGFLGNRSAVATVVGRHFKPKIPTISLADVESLSSQPGVYILDARYPRDFAAGHLPRAINLPIFAGLVERSRTLAAIPPDSQVIVYCQSKNCHWGEVIASDLVFRGYGRVTVFSGGWQEWERHGQSTTQH